MSRIKLVSLDTRDKRLETRVSEEECARIDHYAEAFGFRTRGAYMREAALNPPSEGHGNQPVIREIAALANALHQLNDAVGSRPGWPDRDRTLATLNRADSLFAQLPDLLRDRE